jgi:hypothetical protein
MLLEAAAEEAREAARAVTTEARLAGMLARVSAGTWEPPAEGISLDPYETVTAVLWCATRDASLCDGLVSAVQLGGDTDTVAALVGGLMGCNLTAEQVRADLPWHQLVVLPEPASVRRASTRFVRYAAADDHPAGCGHSKPAVLARWHWWAPERCISLRDGTRHPKMGNDCHGRAAARARPLVFFDIGGLGCSVRSAGRGISCVR